MTATAAALLAMPAAADAEIVDRIVARINDEIVTYYEVKQAATPYVLQNGINPALLEDPEQRAEIYQAVVQDQVDRHLLSQEADELGIGVTDAQVDQWLTRTRRQQNLSEAQFRQMIAGYGMDYETYREMIRQNLLRLQIIQVKIGSQVNITDEEISRAYLERYGSDGGQTKFIEVSNILVVPDDESAAAVEKARQKAEAAREAIGRGADFAQAAEMYSEGPAASNGGYLGRFSEGQLDPDFEEIAFKLEAGEVSDVVRTPFGFHVIKVRDIEYEAAPNLEERKAALRAELQQKAVARQLQAYLQKLRSQSFVEVTL
jgi:peptidyl-prolyl cis-trans isomerase SurA